MKPQGLSLPRHIGEAHEIDYSKPLATDFAALARDRIPVRSMAESDLRPIVAIDRRITGQARAAYLQQKLMEALHQSDVRVSLVAELDGSPVGFVMARVDLGEFGMLVKGMRHAGEGVVSFPQLRTCRGLPCSEPIAECCQIRRKTDRSNSRRRGPGSFTASRTP